MTILTRSGEIHITELRAMSDRGELVRSMDKPDPFGYCIDKFAGVSTVYDLDDAADRAEFQRVMAERCA